MTSTLVWMNRLGVRLVEKELERRPVLDANLALLVSIGHLEKDSELLATDLVVILAVRGDGSNKILLAHGLLAIRKLFGRKFPERLFRDFRHGGAKIARSSL